MSESLQQPYESSDGYEDDNGPKPKADFVPNGTRIDSPVRTTNQRDDR